MTSEKELAQILLCCTKLLLRLTLKLKFPFTKQAYICAVPENPLHDFSIVFCTIWKSVVCVLDAG